MISEALVVFTVLYFVYALFKYRDHAIGTHSRPDLPGPNSWPIVGNLYSAITRSDEILEWFVKNRFIYGLGSSITIPSMRIIDISSPDQIEYVQKTNFTNYAKGTHFRSILQDVLGNGIFNSDGHAWNRSRKTISHIFTANSFGGVITNSVKGGLIQLNEFLTLKSQTGAEFDLQALFFNFTLESFVELAFGQSLFLLAPNAAPSAFAIAFDYAQGQLMNRFPNPLWRFTEKFTKTGKEMTRSISIMDDFAFSIIDRRVMEERSGGEKSTEREKKDLLGLLMGIRDESGQPISRQDLRDHVINTIIAGRDTSAQALSWTMFRLLDSDPSLLATLREEVDRLGECTYESYRDFIQVHAAFNEGLRLHPSVPKNAWEALADDQIPNGPLIHKGDRVRWSDWQMARDPDIWGEDCSEYKPSRWIDEDGNLRRFSNWKFHAFNGGPRLCLGMNLANFESVSVLVTILRSFEISFAPNYLSSVQMLSVLEEKTPRYAPSLTLPLLEPLRVVIKLRKDVM